MTNGFDEMILNMTDTTPEPEDYTGEDGLLYCGKCHKPKEGYFPKETAAWLGRDRHPAECDCQRAERELSLIHIPSPRDLSTSRMPSSA